MIKRLQLVSPVLLSLLIVVSVIDRSRIERRHNADLLAQSSAMMFGHSYNDTGRTLVLLEELRKGDTNQALEGLEQDLYMGVYGVLQYQGRAGLNGDSNLVSRLQEVREYCARYPSTTRRFTDPELAQAIASIRNSVVK